MAKLKMVRLYDTKEVPDHILEEVCDLVNKMGKALSPILGSADPNIILSAFNRFHAAMIVHLIAEDSLENAAKLEAIGILKNIDHMANTKYFGEI